MLKNMLKAKRDFLRVLAAVLLGFMLGALGLTLFASRELDQLHLENSDLRAELASKQQQVQRLEESLQQYRTWIIHDITVDIESEVDEYIAVEVRQQVRSLLNNIIGREIETLDHELVYNIIEGRIIEVDDRRYRLSLRALVIWENMKLTLRVSEVNHAGE